MSKRGALLLILVMALFGFGVNRSLGYFKTAAGSAASPVRSNAGLRLPGRIYLAQDGSLYVLEGTGFSELQTGPGDWSQPAVVPDGSGIVAVLRATQSSNLYLLSPAGKIVRRLTDDTAKQVQGNHWAFYPQVSPDSKTVFFSKDSPKYGYRVDFSVRAFPLGARSPSSLDWTTPNAYTGGDVEAHPLRSGGLLYVKYSIQGGSVFSQLWLQRNQYDPGVALTDAAADCQEPALSPNEDRVLMICTYGKQSSRLVMASFTDGHLGPLQVLVSDQLAAAPTWAPDGSGIVYLAPDPATSRFQLWWLAAGAYAPAATPVPATPKPALKPVEVTTGLDLDPLSQPAWAA